MMTGKVRNPDEVKKEREREREIREESNFVCG